MKHEFKYQANIVSKVLPFVFLGITAGFSIYALILYIPQQAYDLITTFTILLIFSIYISRYYIVCYSLNRIMLTITTNNLIIRTMYGVKTIPFKEIKILDIKKGILLIDSESNSPIHINIYKMNENGDKIYQILKDCHNNSKTLQEVE